MRGNENLHEILALPRSFVLCIRLFSREGGDRPLALCQ